MEKNTVIIGLEEYTNLIKEIEEDKHYIMNLENELRNTKNEQKMVYDKIYTKIYDDNTYRFDKLITNRNDNYYRNLIIDEFKDYGFKSIDTINDAIDMMITRLEYEKGEENGEDN